MKHRRSSTPQHLVWLALLSLTFGACSEDDSANFPSDISIEDIPSDTQTTPDTQSTTDTTNTADTPNTTDATNTTDTTSITDTPEDLTTPDTPEDLIFTDAPEDLTTPDTPEDIHDDIFDTTDTADSTDVPTQICINTPFVSRYTPPQLDLIIAVDTSGSMDEEVAGVQQNLSIFVDRVEQLIADVHVVLIADSSICIPAPLGSGQCGGADENLPAYRHVLQGVASSDALSVILNTYPQWVGSTRPNAQSLFLVVSDDDSNLSAQEFTDDLLALSPPQFEDFIFSAVASPVNPDICIFGDCFFNCTACTQNCCNKAQFCAPIAAAEGVVYRTLATQTGGVFADLCLQDFAAIFDMLAADIEADAATACTFFIPAHPMGSTFDPGQLNVLLVDTATSNSQTVNHIPQGDAGCTEAGGWYYGDANLGWVGLCPATCEVFLGASADLRLDAQFDCDTQTGE